MNILMNFYKQVLNLVFLHNLLESMEFQFLRTTFLIYQLNIFKFSLPTQFVQINGVPISLELPFQSVIRISKQSKLKVINLVFLQNLFESMDRRYRFQISDI
ncbi:hypothetical protein pb186bvf_017820 [Paramecium bursaria]